MEVRAGLRLAASGSVTGPALVAQEAPALRWPSTALLLVDLMPRLLTAGLAPRSGPAVLRCCVGLAEAVRSRGGVVAWVRTDRPGQTQPPGSELAPGLASPEDLLFVKTTVGAFHGQDLHASLSARSVTTLILAGVMTNLAVESTARGGLDHGYRLLVIEDATAAFTLEEHLAAITLDLPRLGEVVSSAALKAAVDHREGERASQ